MVLGTALILFDFGDQPWGLLGRIMSSSGVLYKFTRKKQSRIRVFAGQFFSRKLLICRFCNSMKKTRSKNSLRNTPIKSNHIKSAHSFQLDLSQFGIRPANQHVCLYRSLSCDSCLKLYCPSSPARNCKLKNMHYNPCNLSCRFLMEYKQTAYLSDKKNKTSSSLMFLGLASLHSPIVIKSTYQMLSHMLRFGTMYEWNVNE